ncbi:unnamed protein product, partial [Chrysoparadoxa australica]
TSIQWGPWEGVGMAVDTMSGLGSQSGMSGVTVELSNSVMGAILQSRQSEVIVANVDWRKFSRLWLNSSSRLLSKWDAAEDVAPMKASLKLQEEVAGMDAEQRRQH